jgi:hypothetical protein
MTLSLQCGLFQSQRLETRQELRLEARQALSLRLSLQQQLHRRLFGSDEVYKPYGICPSCGFRLKPVDIIRGFTRNPEDITTKCPRCKKRFLPILCGGNSAARIEVPFYCAAQTQARLIPEMANFSPSFLRSQEAAIYRSAMYHFGSLKAGFALNGIAYTKEPRLSTWQTKVLKFLGRLPDKLIADTARVGLRQVRKLRQEKHIPAYRRG